jgi:hypothetical protein
MTQRSGSAAATNFDTTTALIPFARTEPPIGAVSVNLMIHVHRSGFALADGAWLTGCFEIHDSTGGLAVERGRIRHMDDTVVAESSHTRLTVRNRTACARTHVRR